MRAALKAQMPRTPRTQADFFSQSLRFPPADYAWLQQEMAKTAPPRSLNEVATAHLEDRRTLYSLPRDQAELLLADAKAQGFMYPERVGRDPRIDRRGYIQSVLLLAHRSLVRESLDTTSGRLKVTPIDGEEAITATEQFATSLRLPLELAAWLKEESFFIGSWTDVVRGIFADHRLLFGLNLTHVRLLNGDAKRLGLTRRDYIQHLLTQRYDELLREDLSRERDTAAKKKT